jgi:hypothetical protein
MNLFDMYGSDKPKSKGVAEEWSQKYKSSINCSHPKGFSQKAHCAGKKKHNESVEMEMVCEDCGMCQTHGNLNEIKKGQKDSNGYTKCWPGKHAEGTQRGKNGGQVRNCVPNESQGVAEGHADQQRKVFKKNGKPVGEVGIDRESSPGNGQWYMKCYAYNIDNAGYDSYEEAVAELKHCLKQGVAEGFDQPYPLKWEKSDYGDMDALAKLPDGSPLSIMFNLADMSENDWGVEFYRNNSQSVTGEGDAYRVFATVLNAISQFIKKKKPDTLFFTAVKEEDPTGSRAKLYDRLVQKYATGSGYDLKKVDYPEQTGYKLTRKEQGVAEGRLYYNTIGTPDAQLRSDFNLRKDTTGWFLKENAAPKVKLAAQRAFGSPKLKEYDLSVPSGPTLTKGDDNVISPVGSVTRKQLGK